MIFEDTTLQITEEFDRRMEQLANDMQREIESKLYKKLYERGVTK